MDLKKGLKTICHHLEKRDYLNETAVRENIVRPVLGWLGWPVIDPTTIVPEYPLENRKVDYALFTQGHRNPRVLIEVKAVGQAGQAEKQLFEYAFHQGTPFAVLTDGNEWNFFLPQREGNYLERRLCKFTLKDNIGDPAKQLNCYLNFQRVESGSALRAANDTYEKNKLSEKAEQTLPKAWADSVDDPDSLLFDLLAEKTTDLCGVSPSREQTEKFLKGLNLSSPLITPPSPPQHRQNLPTTSLPTGNKRSVNYELWGQSYEANDAVTAIIEILQKLQEHDPSFLERLAPETKMRKRQYIARSSKEAYFGGEVSSTKPIADGWLLATNTSNIQKEALLKQACSTAGLKFGRDLKLVWPTK